MLLTRARSGLPTPLVKEPPECPSSEESSPAEFGSTIYTEQGSVMIAGPDRTETTGNRAENGGAIYRKSGVVKLDANNYTISSNSPVRGGAIFNDGGRVFTNPRYRSLSISNGGFNSKVELTSCGGRLARTGAE